MILGNNLVGGRAIPNPKVNPMPVIPKTIEITEQESLEIFPSCVVTNGQARKQKDQEDKEKDTTEPTNKTIDLSETLMRQDHSLEEKDEVEDDTLDLSQIFLNSERDTPDNSPGLRNTVQHRNINFTKDILVSRNSLALSRD